MSDHNFKLLVPLIKRDIYRDENPIGYLIRLAVLNHYESANWLIKIRDKRTLSLTFVNAYQLVKSSWNASNMDEAVGIQTQLSPMVLNRSNLRFCSLCLKETRYYRMDWQLKSSLVCKKHSVVLQEACPVCLNRITFEVGRIGYCKCGQDLAESKVESANQFELNLQNFVDGIYTSSITGFSKSSMLSITLHDRIYFIMRLYTWNPIDASTRFKEESTHVSLVLVAISHILYAKDENRDVMNLSIPTEQLYKYFEDYRLELGIEIMNRTSKMKIEPATVETIFTNCRTFIAVSK